MPLASRKAEAESLVSRLTKRELEVCWCLALGMSRQKIAKALGIAVKTADAVVANAKEKLGGVHTLRIPLVMFTARGFAWPRELEDANGRMDPA